MKRPRVVAEVLSRRTLHSLDDGRTLLRLWLEALPSYVPERIGNFEPIRTPFAPPTIETGLKLWRWPFLSTRPSSRSTGHVWMTKGLATHGVWIIEANVTASVHHELSRLAGDVGAALDAEFACVTMLTPGEIDDGRRTETVGPLDVSGKRWNFLIPSHILQRHIPDVYWRTLFGPKYVAIFGRDRLLDTPVHTVEEIGASIALQLTPNIEDLARDPDEFRAIKLKVKRHLGEHAFARPARVHPLVH